MSQITQEQFLEIYKEYKPRLYGAADKIVKDHQKVEDVVHEVFVRLLKQDYSKLDGHLKEWLFTVCRNCSIKQYHKTNRYLLIDDENYFDVMDESTSVSESLINDELVKLMMKCIKKLSKTQQKVVNLRYFKGLSYKEIAKKAKITNGNVGFILHDATARLKKMMNLENRKKGYY
jgi:RNA polymerase sigma-70 factor (ECF subfamily)